MEKGFLWWMRRDGLQEGFFSEYGKEHTEIHLISKTDFCRATVAAIRKEDAKGIYHIGDEGDDTLQSFLDLDCDTWRCKRPWRMPLGLIHAAAGIFELFSRVFGTPSPLTRDFIDIGRVSYYGDTSRFRDELLHDLKYRNIEEGLRRNEILISKLKRWINE